MKLQSFFSRLGSTIYSKQITILSGEAAYQIEKSGFVRNNMKVKVLDFSHQIYVHFHGRKFIEANFFTDFQTLQMDLSSTRLTTELSNI